MNSKALIESYVHEVGQHLPRKMRADIEMELRSLLADGLEEREDDETAVKAFLQELGSPAEFAAQYLPKQVLIGSQLFPIFKIVATVVFGVITAVNVIALSYTLLKNGVPEGFFGWWGEQMANYVRSLVYNLGLVTLIFAVLERVGVSQKESDTEWDPSSLRPVKDPNRSDRANLIASIIASGVALMLMSNFSDWFRLNGGEAAPFFFSPDVLEHIPWLMVTWGIEIVLYLVVLANGRWDKTSRLFELGKIIFDVYVLYRILTGGSIIIYSTIDSIVKSGIGIALIFVLIDLAVKIYRYFTRPPEFTSAPKSSPVL